MKSWDHQIASLPLQYSTVSPTLKAGSWGADDSLDYHLRTGVIGLAALNNACMELQRAVKTINRQNDERCLGANQGQNA